MDRTREVSSTGIGATVSRRSFLGAIALAVTVSSCGKQEETLASAARQGVATDFVDTVGWLDLDGRTAVIAFTPGKLSDTDRAAVLADRGVYPALPSRQMVEVRIELRPGSKPADLKINKANLASVTLAFWNFDDPTPVIRIEKEDWSSGTDFEVLGLEGDMKKGGWAIGTFRGRSIYRSGRGRDEAYTFNLGFQVSID